MTVGGTRRSNSRKTDPLAPSGWKEGASADAIASIRVAETWCIDADEMKVLVRTDGSNACVAAAPPVPYAIVDGRPFL